MKTLILAIVSLISFSACVKEKLFTTKVEGQVVDYGSGEAIEGAVLTLKDGFNAEFTADAITSAKTNEDGSFSVEITGKHTPVLYPEKENEYYVFDLGNSPLTTSANSYDPGGKFLDEVIKLKAKASVFTKFINSNNEEDSVKIYIHQDKWDILTYDLCEYGSSFNFPINLAIGNHYYRYRINYKRDGEWNEIIDSFYVAKGGIYTLPILY